MPTHDDLGIRMKEFYEEIPKIKLMRRTPVIIRIDGKAFHTFTKGFQKPFDDILIKSMQETTKYLCEHIQGCVLGYTQSDEITLVLVDYHKLETHAWFNYEVQKICSIAASMATMAFNKIFAYNVEEFATKNGVNKELSEYINVLENASCKGAMFDARAFNIPKEEVTNCIYWRQLDANRNSIQMVGQANFSHNELHEKTCNMIQDMLMTYKGINWNDFPIYKKRGSCCIKEEYTSPEVGIKDCACGRTRWVIDTEIPMFRNEGRAYIEKLINFD